MSEKTNLRPMNWLCRLGFHSFKDKPYQKTYVECWRCKSLLPGWKRIWESKVEKCDGCICGAYTLELKSDG